MRLVKGSHIIVPKFWWGPQAYLSNDDRVMFVNPYEGDMALIGTTDIPYDRRPEGRGHRYIPGRFLLHRREPLLKARSPREQVVIPFAGVRPLYDDNARTRPPSPATMSST